MTNPTFHALCKELIYELTRAANGLSNRTANDNHRAWWAKDAYQAADRARAALAQPEPVAPPMPVPGDAEGLAEVFWGRYEQPEPVAPTDEELNKMCYYEFSTSTGHGEHVDMLGFARAVLARWGTPANTINQENY
jgi:hypothetical protein